MKGARTRLANRSVCGVYILFIFIRIIRRPFARDTGDTRTDYTSTAAR